MKYSPFKLEEEYNSTEGLYQSSISSGTLEPLALTDFIDEQSLAQLSSLRLDYSEQFGLAALRANLAKLYSNYDLNLDNFLVTSGASEAIFLVFSSLFKHGDTIVAQKPIYQSLFQIAEDHGVNVISWNYDAFSSYEENFRGLQNIFASCQSINALVLNNPNNPMGIVFNEPQIQQIIQLLNANSAKPYLICDEVFRDLAFSYTPSCVELYDRAIALSDMSKAYALPGIRIGYIACRDVQLLENFSAQKNYLSLRSSILSEHIAKYALDARSKILARHKSLIQANRDYIAALSEEQLPFTLPEEFYTKPEQYAGLCLFPKIKAPLESFAKDTFVLKGDVFGDEYGDHFRLGLGYNGYLAWQPL